MQAASRTKTEQKLSAGYSAGAGPGCLSPGVGAGALSGALAFGLPATLTWLMQLESLRLSLMGL